MKTVKRLSHVRLQVSQQCRDVCVYYVHYMLLEGEKRTCCQALRRFTFTAQLNMILDIGASAVQVHTSLELVQSLVYAD